MIEAVQKIEGCLTPEHAGRIAPLTRDLQERHDVMCAENRALRFMNETLTKWCDELRAENDRWLQKDRALRCKLGESK